MDGDEQIRTRLVGNSRTGFERNERVVLARVNYFRSQSRLQQLALTPPHVEDEIFFLQPVRPDGSGIVPSVTRINHDLANFQAQSANQRPVPARGRPRR